MIVQCTWTTYIANFLHALKQHKLNFLVLYNDVQHCGVVLRDGSVVLTGGQVGQQNHLYYLIVCFFLSVNCPDLILDRRGQVRDSYGFRGEVHCGCGSGRDSTQPHTAQVQWRGTLWVRVW